MDGETERVTWDDHTWWECYKEMPYGVRRKARRLMAPYVKADNATQQMVVDEENFNAAVLDDLQMVKLLGCTAAWSWDEDVTEEAIENKPTSKVETVVERMAALYNEDEVEPAKGAKKRTRSRSTSQ